MHRDQFSERIEPLVNALIHRIGDPLLLKQTGTHGRIALVLHPLSRLLVERLDGGRFAQTEVHAEIAAEFAVGLSIRCTAVREMPRIAADAGFRQGKRAARQRFRQIRPIAAVSAAVLRQEPAREALAASWRA